MSEQAQLFEPPAPPPGPPEEPEDDESPPWFVGILKQAALEILKGDIDCQHMHPEDQDRIAGSMAETLAETAMQELMMIAMVNEYPPFDEPPTEPW